MKSISLVVCCLVAALLACAFLEAQAQVNFSPAWGKRAQGFPTSAHARDASDLNTSVNDCKVPLDGVVKVLKMIQVEAQRILRCEGLTQENME